LFTQQSIVAAQQASSEVLEEYELSIVEDASLVLFTRLASSQQVVAEVSPPMFQ